MSSWRFGFLVLGVFILGCAQKGDPNRPKTAPVAGTVTYKGQAVEGATVMFVSASASGRGAVGKTDASGRFTMTTFASGDGAIPGSYRVAIYKTSVEGAPAEGATGKAGAEPSAGTIKDHLPAKYKEASSSGLTADVGDSGVKDLKFDLVD